MKLRVLLFFLSMCLVHTSMASDRSDEVFAFDTKFYDAVDQWVVFPKNQKTGKYVYGFIYIDSYAGMTFQVESLLSVQEGRLVADAPPDNAMFKHRLKANTNPVTVLTDAQIAELGLPQTPKWLAVYKSGEGSAAYLKGVGYAYNHVNAPHLAIDPLTRAYGIDPGYKGLAFELAFAYNATGKYGEAADVLTAALSRAENADDAFLYKELGFSLKQQKKFSEAEKAYAVGIEKTTDNNIKAEMAINMAQAYFLVRDKENFDRWAEITGQYAKPDSRYTQLLELFRKEWNASREAPGS